MNRSVFSRATGENAIFARENLLPSIERIKNKRSSKVEEERKKNAVRGGGKILMANEKKVAGGPLEVGTGGGDPAQR